MIPPRRLSPIVLQSIRHCARHPVDLVAEVRVDGRQRGRRLAVVQFGVLDPPGFLYRSENIEFAHEGPVEVLLFPTLTATVSIMEFTWPRVSIGDSLHLRVRFEAAP